MGASCDSLTCIGWDQIKATARYAGANSDDELLRRAESRRHQSSPKPVPERVEVPDTPSRVETIALRARQLTKRTADAYSLLGADPGPCRLSSRTFSHREPVGFCSTRVFARLYPRRHLRRVYGWERD